MKRVNLQYLAEFSVYESGWVDVTLPELVSYDVLLVEYKHD